MAKAIKILNYILFILLVFLTLSCAPAKKNPFYEKRKKSSQVNASQLGRNRYYFSKDYQKKLTITFKRKVSY
jgi:phosphoglycerol transferase MdoB-like AlkP superfamily enzyme